MKNSLITLLAVAMVGTAAQAQAPTWTGFKAGITLGATTYTNTWTDTDYDWFGGSLSYSQRKVTPAIHVGWDTQIGSVVYGIELDHSFNSSKRDVIYDTPLNSTPRVLKHDELKSVTSLRGRMGVAVDNTLVYATAGVAKAKADHSWTNLTYAPDTFAAFSNDHTGFVYGFGVEHRLNQMFSLRAEYQHLNVPETKSTTNTNGYTMEIGEEVSTFAFGASIHF